MSSSIRIGITCISAWKMQAGCWLCCGVAASKNTKGSWSTRPSGLWTELRLSSFLVTSPSFSSDPVTILTLKARTLRPERLSALPKVISSQVTLGGWPLSSRSFSSKISCSVGYARLLAAVSTLGRRRVISCQGCCKEDFCKRIPWPVRSLTALNSVIRAPFSLV